MERMAADNFLKPLSFFIRVNPLNQHPSAPNRVLRFYGCKRDNANCTAKSVVLHNCTSEPVP
jgi:hypothetical protein